jgi:type II secretory ATPase GspE/PulE/Tfp pilus assembly ATPase PilB-like protein
MVFSTLHTNDAPSTITRLKDMGVPTFLITATVEAILAQRLGAARLQKCREEHSRVRKMLDELELTPDDIQGGKKFFRGSAAKSATTRATRGAWVVRVDDYERRAARHGDEQRVDRRFAQGRSASAWSRCATPV